MPSQSRYARIRPRGWLVLVPAAIVLFFVYRLMGTMSADSLFAVNALCQFALIILGVIVAVKPQTGVEHPWLIIGFFVVLGGIGMVAALRQQQISARETAEAQKQAAEANAKLANNIDALNKGAAEIARGQAETARVQALNTQLQEKLLDSSSEILKQGKVISGLSRRSISATTGGNSFCYMRLSSQWDTKGMVPFFFHKGGDPLYDVHARIADLTKYDAAKGTTAMFQFDTNIQVGNVTSDSVLIPPNPPVFPLGNLQRYDFRVFFNARNGYWMQDLQLQRIDGGWASAVRVIRIVGNKEKVVFTDIDNRFPTKRLQWHQ